MYRLIIIAAYCNCDVSIKLQNIWEQFRIYTAKANVMFHDVRKITLNMTFQSMTNRFRLCSVWMYLIELFELFKRWWRDECDERHELFRVQIPGRLNITKFCKTGIAYNFTTTYCSSTFTGVYRKTEATYNC